MEKVEQPKSDRLEDLSLELSEEEWRLIKERQLALFDRFRNIPEEGIEIRLAGERLVIHREVFIPFVDTELLAETMSINSGEKVLDMCTGSGALAIIAAKMGAGSVLAVDINPAAISTAEENKRLHHLDNVEIRESDIFDNIADSEVFDVIIANLPFMDIEHTDNTSRSIWDGSLRSNRRFFNSVSKHLSGDGRIYFAQANFGPLKDIQSMMDENGLTWRLLGARAVSDNAPRTFYSFEIRPKK